jgi:hypothetical protein
MCCKGASCYFVARRSGETAGQQHRQLDLAEMLCRDCLDIRQYVRRRKRLIVSDWDDLLISVNMANQRCRGRRTNYKRCVAVVGFPDETASGDFARLAANADAMAIHPVSFFAKNQI